MINLDKLDHMIRQLRERIELNKLHNFHQGVLSVGEYIAGFEDLRHHSDLIKHYSQTIIRFVSGLKSTLDML